MPDTLVDLVLVTVSGIAIWKGAIWLVDNACTIASRLGLSPLVIGLTVVAFGTSAPEMAVTVGAALKGKADIAVANVTGSNVFNFGFILGGMALIRSMRVSRSIVRRDGAILLVAAVLLLVFADDRQISRQEGLLFVVALIGYLTLLIRTGEAPTVEETPPAFRWWSVPMLLLGLGLVIGGSHFLVFGASRVARDLGLSEWFIGVTIVAAGTSLPELATSLTAVVRRQHGLSLGNLVGSDLFNILAVLGFAAIVQPLNLTANPRISLIPLCLVLAVVLFMMRTEWTLSRREGAVLILIAMVRWGADFLVQGRA